MLGHAVLFTVVLGALWSQQLFFKHFELNQKMVFSVEAKSLFETIKKIVIFKHNFFAMTVYMYLFPFLYLGICTSIGYNLICHSKKG